VQTSDNGLCYALEALPQLTSLSISQANVTSRISESLARCRNLTRLNLEWLQRFRSDGLVRIARSCTQLKHISLKCSREIDDKGLSGLTQSCANIETADFRGCVKLSNKTMLAIANKWRHLQKLTIGACTKITVCSVLQ